MAWWDHEELKAQADRSERYKLAFPEEYNQEKSIGYTATIERPDISITYSAENIAGPETVSVESVKIFDVDIDVNALPNKFLNELIEMTSELSFCDWSKESA